MILRRWGITLVETLLVVVMLGIVAAVAYPRASSAYRSLQIENAAEQVARDLNRARTEAMRSDQSVSFVRIGTTSYQVGALPQRALPAGVTFVSTSAASVLFPPFGPLSTGSAVLELALDDLRRTVQVSSGGMVTVP